MARMHELLAVESDRKGQAKLVLEESKKVFKGDHNLFIGFIRKLTTFDDKIDDSLHPVEQKEMGSTVPKRLKYNNKAFVKYLDILMQKESTNQVAKADIVIGQDVIAKDVPATMLLSLEKQLGELRSVYQVIPTLDPGIAWEKAEDIGEDVFRMKNPDEKYKTEKQTKSTVVYPHQFPKEGEGGQSIPAVIEKWDEQVEIGKYVKNIWSGMISSAEKSRLLSNIDTLTSAVKKARQRANNTEVVKQKIGQALIDFINDNS